MRGWVDVINGRRRRRRRRRRRSRRRRRRIRRKSVLNFAIVDRAVGVIAVVHGLQGRGGWSRHKVWPLSLPWPLPLSLPFPSHHRKIVVIAHPTIVTTPPSTSTPHVIEHHPVVTVATHIHTVMAAADASVIIISPCTSKPCV